mgnify:CR=1 FL=1
MVFTFKGVTNQETFLWQKAIQSHIEFVIILIIVWHIVKQLAYPALQP